jgi:hypothetical protein
VYAVAFYVLIKSAFVDKKSFELIKMPGKTAIKKNCRNIFGSGLWCEMLLQNMVSNYH